MPPPYRRKNLKSWQDLVHRIKHRKDDFRIGIVGKYVSYEDSYRSLGEALLHGGVANDLRVELEWLDSEESTGGRLEFQLAEVDGILIPGGFGERGIDGMIEAVRYARLHKVPHLGICLGMQVAVIECARELALTIRPTSIVVRRVWRAQTGGTVRCAARSPIHPFRTTMKAIDIPWKPTRAVRRTFPDVLGGLRASPDGTTAV